MSPSSSPDFYFRLRQARLHAIVFEHLCTHQDAAVLAASPHLSARADRPAGFTEWWGRCDSRILSIAWDWALLEDGAICALQAEGPRSNLCVIDDRGYDRATGETAADLWALIETIPWRQHVRVTVRASQAGGQAAMC